MKLYWMKVPEAFPSSSWLEMQFTCFDEDKPDRQSASRWDTYIGDVHQEPYWPQAGMWAWSMTAVLPGPRLPFPRNRKEAERGDAGRNAVECYERMSRFYGRL